MANNHTQALPSVTIAGRGYFVLRFDLDERVSELGVELELWDDADEALPSPGEVLDQPATFTLARSDGTQERSFVGTVVHAEIAFDDDYLPFLKATVAPKLWNLEKRADCRIFQQMTGPDIIKKVLLDAGVPADSQDWRLDEAHAARLYTAQYRETDLAFATGCSSRRRASTSRSTTLTGATWSCSATRRTGSAMSRGRARCRSSRTSGPRAPPTACSMSARRPA